MIGLDLTRHQKPKNSKSTQMQILLRDADSEYPTNLSDWGIHAYSYSDLLFNYRVQRFNQITTLFLHLKATVSGVHVIAQKMLPS